MRSRSYVSFVARSHRGIVLFSLAISASLQFLIIWLFTAFDYGPLTQDALEKIPQIIKSLLGEEFLARLSLDGLASFGFQHPIVLALFAITAITIAARHVSGEAETGTLELLLSYPVRRASLLLLLWASTALLLLGIAAGTSFASLAAIWLYHTLTPALLARMLEIGCNLWVFSVLIMTYTLLISVFSREGGRTGMISAIITVGFYFLHYLSRLWDAIAFTKPFNIFTYFEPMMLMFG